MMEEWAWQPAVLRRITRHVRTGAPIPDDLIRRMHEAAVFDRPTEAGRQLAFAAALHGLHERPAAEVNPDSIVAGAFQRYLGVPAEPGAHLASSVVGRVLKGA